MAQEEAEYLVFQIAIRNREMSLSEDKIKSLISAGSDITGAASGGAIGFLIGGPVGAALGGLSGVVICRTLSEIAGRLLSHRETVRVGATAIFAITKIKERLDSGDKLRDDGFFESKKKVRSDAEEIFEGVLLKAKNEHEEKKTRIIGNIFANTAFYPAISVGQANHVLRIAENLTYRAMCILSLIKRKDELEGVRLSGGDYKQREKISYETMSLLQESYELYNLYLIVPKDPNVILINNWTGMSPNILKLTPIGERYYQVMGLDDIPEEDVREVARHL